MNHINLLIFVFAALTYTTANVVYNERNVSADIFGRNNESYVREKRTPTGGSKGVQLPDDNLNHPIPANILTTFLEAVERRIIERNDQNGGNGNHDPNIAGPSHGRNPQRAQAFQDSRHDIVTHILCMLYLRINDLLDDQENPIGLANQQLFTPRNLRRIMNAILQFECTQNTLSPEEFEKVFWILQTELRLGNSQQPSLNSNDFLSAPIFNFNRCPKVSSTPFANQQLPHLVDTAARRICNRYISHTIFPLGSSTQSDFNNPQAARLSVIRCPVNRRSCDNNHIPRIPHQNSQQQNQKGNNNGHQNPAGTSALGPSQANDEHTTESIALVNYIKTPEQREALMREYNNDPRSPKLGGARFAEIGSQINLTMERVRQWFYGEYRRRVKLTGTTAYPPVTHSPSSKRRKKE